VFGDTAIIIDGIAPFRWMNPNAPTNWMADVELQLTLGDSFINETKIEAMGRGNFEWNIFEVTQKKKDSFIHRHGLSWTNRILTARSVCLMKVYCPSSLLKICIREKLSQIDCCVRTVIFQLATSPRILFSKAMNQFYAMSYCAIKFAV
jgi:hypothetical protein